MGRWSNWIWNRTVKESGWQQEPEIGLRNAPLNTTGANLPKLFLVPRQKGGKGGQGWEKLAKAQHQVTKWLFGCTLSTFFGPFWSKKPRWPKKPSIRCDQLAIALHWAAALFGSTRSKVVSSPTTMFVVAAALLEGGAREGAMHSRPQGLVR